MLDDDPQPRESVDNMINDNNDEDDDDDAGANVTEMSSINDNRLV